jgi:hypothetical protein
MSNVLEVEFAAIDMAAIYAEPYVPEPFRIKDKVLNAWGTRLRLRSLIAMGHNERRMGGALGVSQQRVTSIINGYVTEVPTELARDVVRLWNAWWDLVPPTRTAVEKQTFRRVRARAAKWDWCCPLGLDEELIDNPYYIPGSGWLPATGTGVAEDPFPLDRKEAA